MKVSIELNQHFIGYEGNRKMWLHYGKCWWKFTIDALFLAMWPDVSGRFVIQSKRIMKTFCRVWIITKCNNSFFLTKKVWGKWVTLSEAHNICLTPSNTHSVTSLSTMSNFLSFRSNQKWCQLNGKYPSRIICSQSIVGKMLGDILCLFLQGILL